MENTELQNLLHSLNDPGREFSPVPLWFWNDRPDDKKTEEQILDFRDKGIYAFMIHPRMGIPEDLPYMSVRFLDHVERAVETASRLDMKVCLYDEGMYPSGSAHGQVVACDPGFAAQALIMKKSASGEISFEQTDSGGTIRGIHFGEDGFEKNAPPAANIMDPEAVRCFIRLTHEKYYARLSKYFGNTIFAIFTDEPSLTGRGDMTGRIPWTNGMFEACAKRGIKYDEIRLLFEGDDMEHSSRRQQVRRIFASICRDRLEEAFYKQISHWCSEHDIALTGHPSQSDDIALLKFFHIPGQDLVLRKVGPESDKALFGRDSTLAKCSADSARHSGKKRNSCECFGCCVRDEPSTGWYLPPEDMKWYIDWLAVRGVNLFMPHAFYYSLEGRRAYERPPDVGPAQTWWKNYSYWSAYMTRISALMTDGKSMTSIAVLCTEDHLPFDIAAHLFRNQIDFNYLEESLLLTGEHSYDTILVEDPEIFSKETSRKLKELSGRAVRISYGKDPGRDLVESLKMDAPVRVRCYQPDLRMTCQKKEEYTAVFLVNEGDGEIGADLETGLKGRIMQWDPWNGTIAIVLSRMEKGGRRSVRMRLGFRESTVLIFDENNKDTSDISVNIPGDDFKEELFIGLNEGWDLEIPELAFRASGVALLEWDQLLPDRNFSGSGYYCRSFEMDPAYLPEKKSGIKYILDLGNVWDAVSCVINGTPLGTKFWKPYRFDVTDAVRNGGNRIELEVMNNIACRYKKTDHNIHSGLTGPVTVRKITEGGT